jgi:hypothetical protein
MVRNKSIEPFQNNDTEKCGGCVIVVSLPQSCRLLKSSTKLYSFFQSASLDRFDISFRYCNAHVCQYIHILIVKDVALVACTNGVIANDFDVWCRCACARIPPHFCMQSSTVPTKLKLIHESVESHISLTRTTTSSKWFIGQVLMYDDEAQQ